MNVVLVTVDNPAELLNAGAFGTGALVRLEWSANAVTYTELSTQALVSSTTVYTFFDNAGSDSTYYRSRYSDVGGTNFSDYSEVFRVASHEGYTNADRLQRMAKGQSVDLTYLQDDADAANSWLINEVGRYYGPSTDTVRTFDIGDGRRHWQWASSMTVGRYQELLIPGGLRSFTKVEMKLTSADTSWIDITADVLARPAPWDLLDGMVPDRLVFSDYPTLGYYYFYPGRAVARVTGAFGPATPPK